MMGSPSRYLAPGWILEENEGCTVEGKVGKQPQAINPPLEINRMALRKPYEVRSDCKLKVLAILITFDCPVNKG